MTQPLQTNLQTAKTEADEQFIHALKLFGSGDTINALSILRKIAHAMPHRADFAYNYGVVLQRAGFLDEAIHAWQRATNLAPDHAVPWVNYTLGLSLTGKTQQALEAYKGALSHHPANRDLLFNYANLLYALGRMDDSLKALGTLIQHHPKDTASLINAGKTAKALGHFADAERYYRAAIKNNDPRLGMMAKYNLANLLLQLGHWEEGFEVYEARMALADSIQNPWGLPTLTHDLPKGSRVLIWNDQGAGDAMMYARFLPQLVQKGYRLSLFIQTPLKPLFETLSCFEAVYTPHDAPQTMDVCLSLCSLPFILNSAPTLSWQGAYLHAPENMPNILTARLNDKKRIGIVWAGRPTHQNDKNRSMKLTDFLPLLDLKNTEWYSLQVGERAGDVETTGLQNIIQDITPQLKDFACTAKALSELDLVISVDTAVAHLAGAMGRTVWTLLPAQDCDWRWGLTGQTSFWYPSMRLFRQEHAQGWATVIESVKAALTT